jgi:hypothetical protein
MLVTHYAIPLLKESKGRIVNLGSLVGKEKQNRNSFVSLFFSF